MKEAYWGYWLVALGIFVIVILLLIQNVTSNTTQDHYTTTQITQAALVDAVDYAYYREYKELKINKEKFMESFIRRFADNVTNVDDYNITFTAIYEAPPKVSVEVTSTTESANLAGTGEASSQTFDMTAKVHEILEQNS